MYGLAGWPDLYCVNQFALRAAWVIELMQYAME